MNISLHVPSKTRRALILYASRLNTRTHFGYVRASSDRIHLFISVTCREKGLSTSVIVLWASRYSCLRHWQSSLQYGCYLNRPLSGSRKLSPSSSCLPAPISLRVFAPVYTNQSLKPRCSTTTCVSQKQCSTPFPSPANLCDPESLEAAVFRARLGHMNTV